MFHNIIFHGMFIHKLTVIVKYITSQERALALLVDKIAFNSLQSLRNFR